MTDKLTQALKPQFASAPQQARKTATVEEALAAAAEFKGSAGNARRMARQRRAELSRLGKMALPPEQR
jgi:hypothetical protein